MDQAQIEKAIKEMETATEQVNPSTKETLSEAGNMVFGSAFAMIAPFQEYSQLIAYLYGLSYADPQKVKPRLKMIENAINRRIYRLVECIDQFAKLAGTIVPSLTEEQQDMLANMQKEGDGETNFNLNLQSYDTTLWLLADKVTSAINEFANDHSGEKLREKLTELNTFLADIHRLFKRSDGNGWKVTNIVIARGEMYLDQQPSLTWAQVIELVWADCEKEILEMGENASEDTVTLYDGWENTESDARLGQIRNKLAYLKRKKTRSNEEIGL
jgi:hypothetical protein